MKQQMKDKSLEKMLGIEGLVKRYQKQNSIHNQYDPCSIYQPKKNGIVHHYSSNGDAQQFSPPKNMKRYSPMKNGKTANRITRKAFNRDKKLAIYQGRQPFVYIENRKDL